MFASRDAAVAIYRTGIVTRTTQASCPWFTSRSPVLTHEFYEEDLSKAAG